jgi:DNA-binding MarR family transcriptional regulator
MSRLVQGLVRDALVARAVDRADQRALRLRATARGRRLLLRGRALRVALLAERLRRLRPSERAKLDAAVGLIARLAE